MTKKALVGFALTEDVAPDTKYEKYPFLLLTPTGPVPLTSEEALSLKWQISTAVNMLMERNGVAPPA